ncbi:uncharacterized protein LOC128885207 isoform X1 [Hylaeus volcanicus]|uniref:uncharacterized protein LOC128885207 isoform X1 n=1 Tax=Hylaeus volcanicus TaxID=313075 RepID=UPI0023B791B6|nr:uncharacterized protein LOC128885207 isoform X1 [Hylaeus volcanicus]
MSARSQREIKETSTTRRSFTPRVTGKKRAPKPEIIFEYDVAISKPDLPNFLELKKNGRYPMVSGVPLKKRALKTRVRSRLMSRKNFQTRPRVLGTKSSTQRKGKVRSPDSKNSKGAKNAISSPGISDEEKKTGEKENVIDNGTTDGDESSNLLKKNKPRDGSNVNDAIEAIKNIDTQQTSEKKPKDERSSCESSPAKSPVLQIKGSRIPRAKILAFPIHTVHEFHSAKKVTVSDNAKDPARSKGPTTSCIADNVETPENDSTKKCGNRATCKEECLKPCQKDAKVAWDDGKISETETDDEAEGDQDESPIDNVDDPRVMNILKNLKLTCPCNSCTDHEPLSTNRQEDDSDSKSSSPEECRKTKWPLKRRNYVDTSSEGMDDSSDRNNAKNQKKSRNRMKAKSPVILQSKSSSLVKGSSKNSSRHRSKFSFFNTLFDIVFWPYLFLKTNR